MRKIKLFLSMLMLIAFSVGNVWADEVSFAPSDFSGKGTPNTGSEMSVTKDGVTVAIGKGYGTTEIRAYSGSSFSISSSNTITALSFTFSGGKTGGLNTSYTGLSTTEWSQASLSSQARFSNITVTYTAAAPSTPTLSVSPTVIDFGTVDQGASVEAQEVTVTYENLTGAVTYSGLSGAFTASGAIAASGSKITITPNTDNTGNFQQTLTVQSTADSKSAEVTVKMNVVAPFDGLKLTFDVSSNPGEWPTTNSTTTTDYTYPLNEVDYTFALNNVKCNSGYLMLTSVAKLGLPAISGYKLVKVEATNSSNCSTTTQVSVSSSDATKTDVTGGTAQTWGTTSTKYTYNLSGTEENTMYYLWIANKNCQLVELTLYYEEAEAATVATPVISGTESFLTSTEVSIACTTDGATVYYTTDGTDPKTSESKQTYSAAFTLTNTATVRAIATKDAAWSSEATSKTFTKITPITVAAAIAAIPNKNDVVDNQYVSGIVCTAGASVSSGKMTYYISDDGSETNRLQIYKGKNLNNTEFTAVSNLAIGDRVTVFGQLKNFNNTPEMNDGNYLVSKEGPAVAAPEFTPNGGGFMGETDVTITCATGSSTIYYTLDGTNPTKLSTLYEGAIHLDATTTIKAIAYVGDDASLVITKTFTLTAPMTVAEALDALDSEDPINNVAVAGIISTAPTSNPSSGKLTYYISNDGTDTDELEVFNGYGLNGASFSAKTDLQVGDEVTVFGNLTIYNSTTKEFAAGSRLLAFNRPEVAVTSIDLTESTAEVEEGSTVTLHAAVVPANATNKTIVWSVQSGNDYASVDENGVVTGIAAGEAVVRAAAAADENIYEECTVTVTAVDPTKHVVTFDATLDYGDSPLVKGDITMTCTSGALNNQSEYRLYKNGTTTFECSAGNIIKIEFTGVSGNPISGFGDPEVGTLETSGNDGVWTGNAESVAFAASGAQVRATLIKVTYKEDNRDAAGLAWNPAGDIELTVGDAFSAPALLNPNSIDAAEISIASSNTDVATVTAGVVSLVADATGTTTITATFAGNDDYKPATISYNITVNEAGLDNVTFDSSEDHAESGETTITKGGFTLSFTSGSMDGTQAEYRLYKSQTMTLSSTDYLIKKIEFTCTSGNPITGFADATGLDKDNNEWTGESNTVELTASNAQVRMTKIKVFYVEDTRAAAGLAWDPADDIELTVGDALSAPALQNPNNIAENLISITSSNTDLATVTAGEVALVADATGTTTITATFAGNDDFKPATVSYKITVNPAHSIYVSPSLNVNFGNVDKDAEVADKAITVTLTGVDAATLTLAGDGASAFTISPAAALTASGDITISASSANLGTFAATLTISDDASQAESKVVHLSLTVNEVVVPETPVSTTSQWVAATEIADGMEVLIVGEENGTFYAMSADRGNNRGVVAGTIEEGVFTPGANTMAFTLVAQDGGTYALRASNGKYLYAGGTGNNNWLNTKAYDGELDANAKWNIDLANSTIIATSSNRNEMRFNKSNNPKIISCYQSSSTYPTVALYVPKPAPAPEYEAVRTELTPNAYYTMCLERAVTDVRGGSIWRVLSKAQNTSDIILEEVDGTLDAGRPYIFFATADKLEVVYEGAAVGAPITTGNNGLVGSFTKEPIAQAATNYIIYNNALYFVNSDKVYVGAHRAYLDMTGVPAYSNEPQQGNAPRRRVTMAVYGEQVATGMESIQPSEISNQKVLINGQLFILRGEKMYDATGRLVK